MSALAAQPATKYPTAASRAGSWSDHCGAIAAVLERTTPLAFWPQAPTTPLSERIWTQREFFYLSWSLLLAASGALHLVEQPMLLGRGADDSFHAPDCEHACELAGQGFTFPEVVSLTLEPPAHRAQPLPVCGCWDELLGFADPATWVADGVRLQHLAWWWSERRALSEMRTWNANMLQAARAWVETHPAYLHAGVTHPRLREPYLQLHSELEETLRDWLRPRVELPAEIPGEPEVLAILEPTDRLQAAVMIVSSPLATFTVGTLYRLPSSVAEQVCEPELQAHTHPFGPGGSTLERRLVLEGFLQLPDEGLQAACDAARDTLAT